MDWTPEKAVAVDARVRAGLRSSRAGLMRFVVTDGWRALPDAPDTAAAYVQDVAGVKRSEAYRIVSTARVISVLATYVEDAAADDQDELFRWILDDVVRSTHTGEWLTSILTDLITTLDGLLEEGSPPRDAIVAAVEAHPRPQKDPTPPPPSPTDTQPDRDPAADAEDELAAAEASVVELPKAERILVCPHCGGQLR